MKEKKLQLKEVFTKAGIDYTTMEEESIVDIHDKNIKTKSFNHSTNQVEFKLINALVRKKDSPIIKVINTHSKEVLFKGTLDHKVWLLDDGIYSRLEELLSKDVFLLDEKNEPVLCSFEKTNKVFPILDINVEGNENYFTGGILSHNTGGNALPFYASIRLDVRRIETTNEGGEATANRIKIKSTKNKTYPPFKVIETAIIFGEGIDKMSEIIDMAVKFDIINKAGSWYSYGEQKIGQGKSKVKNLLEENEELKEEIILKVKAKIEENKIKSKPKRTPVEEAIEVDDKEEEKENE